MELGEGRMNTAYKKLNNLFLGQSYIDAWEDYGRSLRKTNFIKWDYIILTASNEAQAAVYREQIQYRLENQLLPAVTKYAVLPDPDGKRVGSGGATFNVLKYIAQQDGHTENHFTGKRILVIHSGGDSKRVPQYSACGKLFSPVLRELPDGRGSTLFDEFIIAMSGVPSRIKEGMLVLSGDVLLLFNALQIDSQFDGAMAISIKEKVEIGKNHGVFLNDGNNYVGKFLHKQTEENLRRLGAVNGHDCVDLDTGAVALDANLLNGLFSLISTNNRIDTQKFDEFVNEKVQISFYGDFLYPLAKDATLEQYYQEACEGMFCEELTACRKKLWEVLAPYNMKLLSLSPAEFIHFGTTRELLELVTEEVDYYEFLSWKKQVISNVSETEAEVRFAANNAYIGARAKIGDGSYIEDSYILGESQIGGGSIISNLKLRDYRIPDGVVMHGLKLQNGKYTVRVYGVQDNPKDCLSSNAGYLNTSLADFLEKNALEKSEIWDGETDNLWTAKLFPVSESMEKAVDAALILCKMADGTASGEEISLWKSSVRTSLQGSFNDADTMHIASWKRELENRVVSRKLLNLLEAGVYYKEALKALGNKGITPEVLREMMNDAYGCGFSSKIRLYYAISRFMKENKITYSGKVLEDIALEEEYRQEINGEVLTYDMLEGLCFTIIQNMIYECMEKEQKTERKLQIARERVDVELPVRVNWGGGWTDTPPFCNEQGGVVLNAALKINGKYPVCVTVKRLEEYHVEFESQDVGAKGTAESIDTILDCHNPYDPFALHKAALIACGIITMKAEKDAAAETLEDILKRLGGGIYLSTQVIGIPKGSGLGTSSILSGACVKGLFEFLGQELREEEIYNYVLYMEQIMSTGGGWQDQVGGLTKGIKFITTKPGMKQDIRVETVELPPETRQELQERFALIYTGQRRLARNLLRDVVGNYIGADPSAVSALHEMKRTAALMRFELEQGNVDEFAGLLNRHWELSKQLDGGTTNTCIEQMFTACEDLLDGRFIAGAGGGGFLQVILKKGVTKKALNDRLYQIFQDSGVALWECEFI